MSAQRKESNAKMESVEHKESPEPAAERQTRAIGAFPRLSLKRAQDLVQAIYKLGEGEPVRRLSVFNEMKRAADSGSSRMLVTTAGGGYGLTTGSYKADKLGITARGLALVAAESELQRLNGAYDALFSNEIFASFVGRFRDKGFPNAEIAVDFLKSSCKLSDSDAAVCLGVIRENVEDWGLLREYSGRRIVITRDMAIEEGARGIASLDETGRRMAEQPQPKRAAQVEKLDAPSEEQLPNATHRQIQARTAPQIHFNIQIHLPESATPESYDAIFESIAKHLLGQSNLAYE